MKKVSIIGFGRFGKTLYRLIKNDFDMVLYDKNPKTFDELPSKDKQRVVRELNTVFQSEVIFYAVPISKFESVIKSHKKHFKQNHLLIDVLSVKVHPKNILQKALKGLKTQALLTHPMFGPDSSKNGFEGLPIILDKFTSNDSNYNYWKKYFESKKLRVIEMSSQDHDKLAANSQGLTHFIGRLLEKVGLEPTTIDSLGTRKLLEVKDQTCNDTWELFSDLQTHNPYTKPMRLKLGRAHDKLYNQLLPKHINQKYVTIGIQGGKGSFNEEAITHHLEEEEISKLKIKYLYTCENVLSALHKSKIDLGQFAIHNSIGGVVGESINAMARYKFKIVKEFAIKISHTLMIRNDSKLENINTIMTHPQVLSQCKSTLAIKYPHLKLISGKGTLVDHALVAKRLSEKKLPKNIATMGSKVLAQIYNLKVIEENLQDAKENFTSFLVVERI